MRYQVLFTSRLCLNKYIHSPSLKPSWRSKAICQLLQGKPRDYLLWVMGINNGLRASDLVMLKVHQV